MTRIVVTGMGCICPTKINHNKNINISEESKLDGSVDSLSLSPSLDSIWSSLLKGESGITKIERFEVIGSAAYCKIAGLVDINFDPFLSKSEQGRNGRFIHFALAATHQALADAGLIEDTALTEKGTINFATKLTEEQKERVAVIVGSGIGGINEMYEASLSTKAGTRLHPFFIPACLINSAPSAISLKYGFKGPNQSVVTACSSGAHSIIDGFRMLRDGDVDFAIVGGAEASACPLGLEGFAAMKALCAGFNDNPTAGSRPYDTDRSGFVMGEGAGIMVLEREEDAIKRGAKIHAYIAGFGATADAYHVTNPNPDGAARAMRTAIKMAGIEPKDIKHMNAHATSTPAGDKSELQAIKSVFGDDVMDLTIAATKSSTGHLLGAAGAIEAIFAVMALKTQQCPPVLNLTNRDEEAYYNGKELKISNNIQEFSSNYTISNSFGFGGTNSALIFGKVD